MSNLSRRGKVTNLQLFTLVINNMFATGVFTIARTTAEAAGRGFAISIALATIFSLLQLLSMYLLASRFPEQSIAEYAPLVLGKILGSFYLLGYVLLALGLPLIVPRNFWLVLGTWIFQTTPPYALLIPLLLVCWNTVRRGVIVLARMSEIIFLLSIPGLLMLLTPHSSFNFDQLLPLLDRSPLDLLKGILPAYFAMTGFDIILFVYPFTNRKRTLQTASLGVTVAGFVYAVSSILVVGTLGLEFTLMNTWPLQQYLNHFSFAVLERIDIIVLITWTMQVISTVAISYYTAAASLRGIFPRLGMQQAATILLPLLLIATFVPIRLPPQVRLQNIYSLIALFYVGLLPSVLWMTSLIRGKGGERDAQDSPA